MYSENDQKGMLLSSMEKLIKYIQVSRENQWEIFQSLSKKDISKIISNFDDQESKIRKLSLTLFGSLLNNNNTLKQRLCQRMKITPIPGKICISFNPIEKIKLSHEKTLQLVSLLRDTVTKQDEIFPIWVISLRDVSLKINFIPLSALNYIDPNGHLIGFTLLPEEDQSPKKIFLRLFESVTQSPKVEVRKPIFQTAPMTERNSSNTSQKVHRFNRTTQKTSLKQPLKRSLILNNNQSEENDMRGKSKETNYSSTFKSQRVSHRKEHFFPEGFQQSSVNQKQTLRNFRDNLRDNLNSTILPFQKKDYSRQVINNTNIYINVPVNSISVNGGKVQSKMTLKNRQFQEGNYASPRRNLNQVGQNYSSKQDQSLFNMKQCFPSGSQSECNIFIRPFKKYQRVTVKQNRTIQARKFDVNQYQEFIKKANTSEHQEKKNPNKLKDDIVTSSFQDN